MSRKNKDKYNRFRSKTIAETIKELRQMIKNLDEKVRG